MTKQKCTKACDIIAEINKTVFDIKQITKLIDSLENKIKDTTNAIRIENTYVKCNTSIINGVKEYRDLLENEKAYLEKELSKL